MTVTCKLVGGLGNCLFILCATIAYALKHGCDYCIPTHIDAPHEPEQKVFHSDKLNFCTGKTLADELGIKLGSAFTFTEEVYTEPFFHYKEIPKFDVDKLTLVGYYQSFLHFQDYRAQILTLLDIPKAIGYGRIFLHYRLGDYKHLGKFHQMISEEYIVKALQLFYDKGYRDIIIFSDEIEEVKKRLYTDSRFNWQYSEGKTALQDLSLMAACAGGIMSASAFSWFGAWLGNQNRMIVYPSRWFGEEYESSHSIADLCPPQWQAL